MDHTAPVPSPALSRAAVGRPPAPVRAAHLGLGAFFRAHAAWYTARADEGWGIDAFTGRRPDAARTLAAQDGLYTLLIRGPAGDEPEVVASVVEAHHGGDSAAWLARAADPALAVLTLTVTEYAYRRSATGGLATDDTDVVADLAELAEPADLREPGGSLRTVPGRLVAGLAARRAAGAGPLAVVSCDNLPANGEVLRRVVTDFAEVLDDDGRWAGLAGWIGETVSFPTTMVDRITPATTAADRDAAARLTGCTDAAPVVTEPFTEWVLAGRFPAGRPAWEAAGARFVDDVSPFEDRKLWLLNGSHSMLAYTAAPLGFTTVAGAVADAGVRRSLDDLWDTATPYLRLPEQEIRDYREALLDRYANPNIAHRLTQIAGSGSQKLAVRIVPLLRRHLADGHEPPAPLTRVLGGWLAHLRGVGVPVDDPLADTLVPAAAGPLADAARRVLAVLDEDLAGSAEVVRDVAAAAADTAHRAGG